VRFRIFRSKPGPTPFDPRTVEVEEFDYTMPDEDGFKMPMAHCDQSILHAPGECQYCDHYPQAQALRKWWRINFTGHQDPDKAPCPSTLFRPDEVRDLWGGNVPLAHTGPGFGGAPAGSMPPCP
jgi:hypothetical protein